MLSIRQPVFPYFLPIRNYRDWYYKKITVNNRQKKGAHCMAPSQQGEIKDRTSSLSYKSTCVPIYCKEDSTE